MDGIQKKLEYIGKYGCYFFCLLKLGKMENQYLYYYNLFLEKGWIDRECTVFKPWLILKELLGKTYNVEKTTTFDEKATFIIAYFYNPSTKLHHFVIIDKKKNVIYDSLGDSNTVKNGYIESYRLFYEVK
jgi:hypothetical protein